MLNSFPVSYDHGGGEKLYYYPVTAGDHSLEIRNYENRTLYVSCIFFATLDPTIPEPY